jgi:hypothetical protein
MLDTLLGVTSHVLSANQSKKGSWPSAEKKFGYPCLKTWTGTYWPENTPYVYIFWIPLFRNICVTNILVIYALDICINTCIFHVKFPLFLPSFNQNWNVFTKLHTTLKCLVTQISVQCFSACFMQAGRQAGRHTDRRCKTNASISRYFITNGSTLCQFLISRLVRYRSIWRTMLPSVEWLTIDTMKQGNSSLTWY